MSSHNNLKLLVHGDFLPGAHKMLDNHAGGVVQLPDGFLARVPKGSAPRYSIQPGAPPPVVIFFYCNAKSVFPIHCGDLL